MKSIHKNLWFPLFIICLLFFYFDNQMSNQFAMKTDDQIGGIGQRIIILALDILMLFYVFLYHTHIRNNLLKVLFIISFCIALISSILSGINATRFTITLYLTIILPLLTLLFINSAIYRIGKKKVVVVFSLMVVLLGVHYFVHYNVASVFLGVNSFVTNASYILLMFLPLVLCINNRIIKYGIVVLIVYSVLASGKRGGIIAIGSSLLFFLIYRNVGLSNIKRMIILLFSLSVFSMMAYYLFNRVNLSSDNMLSERFMKMEESGGSDRTTVYRETINMIKSSDFVYLMLGHGWNSVLRDSPLGLSAHNDFLEVQYDFGLFVLIIYFLFYIFMFQQLSKMSKAKSIYTGQFASTIPIIIVISNVSHIIIYPSLFMIEMIVFSCIVQFDKLDKNENRYISVPVGG